MSVERRQSVLLPIAFILATVFYSVTADSAIISTTGEVSVLSAPPASVAAGGAESNNFTRVFLEQFPEQPLTLTNTLTIDNTATGAYGPNGEGNGSPGVVIPAGEIILSYFFDFDPVGTSCCGNSVGSVTFDRDIIGVIFTAPRLDVTDSQLGYPDTAYSPTEGREVNTGINDRFTISSNRRTISFNFTADTGQDQMRVIVDAGVENQPPVAVNNAYSVAEDTILTVAAPGVLGNDTDADGDTLTAILVSGPSSGTLTLNSDGSFTYTSDSNFNGTDSFTYQASDGELTSNTATVTLTVSASTDPPVARDDTYPATEETALTVSAPGVLANDSDADGDTLTAVLISDPSSGTLTLNANGSFTYTPDPDFNGTDSFTYEASDGALRSNTATVTISVSMLNVNNLPIADAGPDQTVNEGASVTLDGSGSRDPDGEPLTTYQWVQVAGPEVSLTSADSANPTFTAPTVPRGGATLTFELTVSDGSSTSTPDTVNVTVTDVNHAPEADAGTDQRVNEGAEVMLDGRESLDPDNDSLTYRWAQLAGDTVQLSDPTSSTPRFTAPLVGPVAQTLTFELTVSDGLASARDTVDVVVENVNHAPTANAGSDQTVNEGAVVTLDGRASSDPDSDPLSYSWSPTSGTGFTLSGDHRHPDLYSPAAAEP